jgi:hypothetical protein
MAKKEAHAQALKIFIDSNGETSLKAIAEEVGVSSFTVGRWHKTENWKEKIGTAKSAPGPVKRKKAGTVKSALAVAETKRAEATKTPPSRKRSKPAESAVIRKRDVFDQAVKVFQESGGKISNVELGKQVKVSAVTIAKWKKMPEWSQAAPVTVKPEPTEATPAPQIATAPESAPAPQSPKVDLESITALQDLVTLNERLRSVLERNFLTAAEIEYLSNAKLALLEAAEVYLGIVKGKKE